MTLSGHLTPFTSRLFPTRGVRELRRIGIAARTGTSQDRGHLIVRRGGGFRGQELPVDRCRVPDLRRIVETASDDVRAVGAERGERQPKGCGLAQAA